MSQIQLPTTFIVMFVTGFLYFGWRTYQLLRTFREAKGKPEVRLDGETKDRIMAKWRDDYINALERQTALRLNMTMPEYLVHTQEEQTAGREEFPKINLDLALEILQNSKYPTPECVGPWEIKEYGKTGTLPKDVLNHVDECYPCRRICLHEREIYLASLKPDGPDCLNSDELTQVQDSGTLPIDRLDHLKSCGRCGSKYQRNREIYINRVIPLPDEPCFED